MPCAPAPLVHTDEGALVESTASGVLDGSDGPRAISSVEERSVHTGKVSGSTPLSPTTSKGLAKSRRAVGGAKSRNRIREVYFVRGDVSGLIKIGVTNDIERRLRSLQTFSAEPLTLLGVLVCPDYGRSEGWVHAQFSAARSHGEWFRPADDLLAFIGQHALDRHQAFDVRAREARRVGSPINGFPGVPRAVMLSAMERS
jgi:hypothetical protein